MNEVLPVLIVIAAYPALVVAIIFFFDYRPAHGRWPFFGCADGRHRKKRTLRTLRDDPAYSESTRKLAGVVTDVNECSRCGAAYEERRPESAAEYAERTKLGEDWQ